MARMGRLITAREAAARSGRSHSQIHRDATSGRLPVAQQFPGYNGPRLFDVDVVDEYAEAAKSTEQAAS